MNSFIDTLLMLLQTGLGGLAAYLAAHVLLCLLPAFFIAGALAALIPKEAVTRFLGKDTPKWISYPMAAVGGFTLAVCSCTIMPLFAGIYKKGAGLGPAITFLFVGPAVNILAISFTGVQIGMDIAIARVVLSLLFGVIIGLMMAKAFEKDDEAHNQQTNNNMFAGQAKVPAHITLFLAALLGALIAGTLQVGLLTNAYLRFTLPAPWAAGFQAWLDALVPPNPAFGVEGISVHGVALIALLIAISAAAVKGFNNVYEGLNRWSYVALGLIAATLFMASLRVELADGSLMVGITGKFIALVILLALLARLARRFEASEMGDWLWETWRFVKQIIPLLLVGVFVAGMAGRLIPPGWIQAIAGSNTVGANLAGVLFGVFMYFPTLVEVPVAQTFLSLGMQRGPLLAYLLADPVLSLQSILITRSIIGGKKMVLYVTLITVFSTLAGLLFGLTIK